MESLGLLNHSQPTSEIHVATIVDILGKYILVHFDGWPNSYGYWTHTSSTKIHPVNWCYRNDRHLCAPNGYNGNTFI